MDFSLLNALGNACSGFLEPLALALELQQLSVVHEPVEQWADDDHVAEELRPVLQPAIGGDG